MTAKTDVQCQKLLLENPINWSILKKIDWGKMSEITS